LGLTEIAADVRQGTQTDALWFALGANRAHGGAADQGRQAACRQDRVADLARADAARDRRARRVSLKPRVGRVPELYQFASKSPSGFARSRSHGQP
jgi:hypothetical protein